MKDRQPEPGAGIRNDKKIYIKIFANQGRNRGRDIPMVEIRLASRENSGETPKAVCRKKEGRG